MQRVKNFKEWVCPPKGWNYLPALIAVTAVLWAVLIAMIWIEKRYNVFLIPK